ncbi:hypothetical protein L1049_008254 [Liquidambar formosana]|uniref:Uncharacterized protein n=1 Tax=Liquidambar formosana TaxID=63359 RepID=A0AAP0S9E0_LIQFO
MVILGLLESSSLSWNCFASHVEKYLWKQGGWKTANLKRAPTREACLLLGSLVFVRMRITGESVDLELEARSMC